MACRRAEALASHVSASVAAASPAAGREFFPMVRG
eukprot:gene6593-11920_t